MVNRLLVLLRTRLTLKDRRIIRGSLVTGSTRFILMAISILQTAFLTHVLSLEEYGLLSTVAVVNTASVFITSVGGKLSNKIANTLGKRSPDAHQQNQRLFMATFLVCGLASVLIIMGFLLVQRWLPWQQLINLQEGALFERARWSFVIAFVLLFASLPFGLASSAFFGYQDTEIVAVQTMLAGALTLLLLVLMPLNENFFMLAVQMPFVAGIIVNLGVFCLLFRRRVWSFAFISLVGAWRIFRPLLFDSLMFIILGFTANIISSTLIYMVSLTQGFTSAGIFSVYWRFFSVVSMVQLGMMLPLWPAYAERQAANDWFWIRNRLGISIVVSWGVVSAGSLGILLFGAPMAYLLTGKSIVLDEGTFFFLTLWTIIGATQSSISIFLNGIGALKTQVVINTVAALVMPYLSITLGKTWGTAGTVLGGILPLSLITLVIAARAGIEIARHSRPIGKAHRILDRA